MGEPQQVQSGTPPVVVPVQVVKIHEPTPEKSSTCQCGHTQGIFDPSTTLGIGRLLGRTKPLWFLKLLLLIFFVLDVQGLQAHFFQNRCGYVVPYANGDYNQPDFM